ncbi:unnamed protein product [Brassica rapa subsp. narinosa]
MNGKKHMLLEKNTVKNHITCWLFLTSLTRKAKLQEVELEKQPSSSKRRLQSLAKKRLDVRQQKKCYHISYRISNFKAQKKRPDVRKCLTETLLPQPLL